MLVDYPYIIFILILSGLSFFSLKGNNADRKMFQIASSVVFIFFALRAPIVGGDTWDYYRFFTGVRNYYNDDVRDIETIFVFYARFLRSLTLGNGLLIMFVNTFLSLVMIYKLIKEYSPYRTISVLLFFLFGSGRFYLIALRQILGISLLLIGLYCIMKNLKMKWFLFVLFVLLGWGIHTSIIIAGVVYAGIYFIPLRSRWMPIAATVLTVALGAISHALDVDAIFNAALAFSGSATERLDNYMTNIKYADDPTSMLVLLRMSIIAIITFLILPKEKLNHWFTKMFLVGICIQNSFYSVVNIGRGVLPFSIFYMIVFAWAIYYLKDLKPYLRKWMRFTMIIVILYFVRAYIVENINYDIYDNAKIHPYDFVFEDYSNNTIFKHPDINR